MVERGMEGQSLVSASGVERNCELGSQDGYILPTSLDHSYFLLC